MQAKPFTIDIAQTVLDDLQARLERTRWTNEVENSGWQLGTNLAYVKELVAYWQHGFDWRKQEAELNAFAHFRAEIDGLGLHFIHERGQGPSPMPLMLLHGWPDSFYRMHKLIPLLTDPASHGGNAEDAFDIVVPSIPGFGFSDKPMNKEYTAERVVNMLADLMTQVLGYRRFGVHGGDVGSSLTEWLGRTHGSAVTGIHLTDVPYLHLYTVLQEELSPAEQKYLEEGQHWNMTEGAYAAVQATKPQTLAYGLNDSPVGLAAWIVDKFRAWSDCDGDIENSFSKDELLTNVMIYWATETINSSFLPYHDQSESSHDLNAPFDVPTGVAIFPKDIVPAPREFGERFFNIQRWTELPRGGHFAALEEPELLAEEVRAFYRPLRGT